MSIQTQIDRIANEVSTQTSLISQIVDELQGKSGGITPSGELEITENGTYDVTTYASANVNVEGLDTSDATATADDILSGKTAYVNGEKVTGKIATVTQPAPTISVSSSGLIRASYPTNRGYTAYIDEMTSTKQLTTQSSQTITPSTSDKTIASGRYLTGTQTIKGDSNLVASNIKSGVSIFGVNGTYEGSGGSGGGSVELCDLEIIDDTLGHDAILGIAVTQYNNGNLEHNFSMDEHYNDTLYQNVVAGSLVCIYVPDEYSFGANEISNATFVGSFSYAESYCCNFFVCGSGSSYIGYDRLEEEDPFQ